MDKRKRASTEVKASTKRLKGNGAKEIDNEDGASGDKTPSPSTSSNGSRLGQSFYEQNCEDLAKALLGKKLVRQCDDTGERLSGIIVETESYLGVIDKAAHSYNWKKTEKTAAMFMDPGTAYVYHIYGMYCCMNISSQGQSL